MILQTAGPHFLDPSGLPLLQPAVVGLVIVTLYVFQHKAGKWVRFVVRALPVALLCSLLAGSVCLLVDFLFLILHFGELPPILLWPFGVIVGLVMGLFHQLICLLNRNR